MDVLVMKFNEIDALESLLKTEINRMKTNEDKRFENFVGPKLLGSLEEGKSIWKIRTYNYTVSWSEYIKQFEAAEVANRWKDQDKVTTLIVALRDDALDILQG